MTDEDRHWLTYEEAAQQLGVGIESVQRRAARNDWPRRVSNDPRDRRVRIGVPSSALPSTDLSPAVGGQEPMAALMERLTERAIQAEGRAAAAEATVAVQAREIRRLMSWRSTKHPKVLLKRLDRLAKAHQR